MNIKGGNANSGLLYPGPVPPAAEQVHGGRCTHLQHNFRKHLLLVSWILILLGKEGELLELELFTYKRFICCVNNGAAEWERLPTGRWLTALDKFTFIFSPCYFVMPGSIFHGFLFLLVVWTLISYALLCSHAHIITTFSPFRLFPPLGEAFRCGWKGKGTEMNKLVNGSVMEWMKKPQHHKESVTNE